MGDGTGRADQRAESLRRMFPQRQPTAASPPPPVPAPPVEPRVGPARRRWPVTASVIGVLALAGVAGAVSLREPGEAGAPPVPIGQSFPVVAPPSFDAVPSSPALVAPASVDPSSAEQPSTSPIGPRRSASPQPAGTRRESGPVTAYSACAEGGSVVFTATFAGGYEFHHVFIDADGDASTGYHMDEVPGGFGADYLLENEYFYQSTGRDWAWREMDGVSPLQSRSGGTYRWRLRPGHAGIRAVFNVSDGAASEGFTPIVPVGACLSSPRSGSASG